MASHIKVMTGLLMAGLFAFIVIMFAIGFASDNDAAISIGDDTAYTSLRDEISSNVTRFSTTSANESSKSYFSSTISSDDEATESGSQFKVGIDDALSIAKSAIYTAYVKIFGTDTAFGIVLTAFISALLYVVALLAYRAWRGSP